MSAASAASSMDEVSSASGLDKDDLIVNLPENDLFGPLSVLRLVLSAGARFRLSSSPFLVARQYHTAPSTPFATPLLVRPQPLMPGSPALSRKEGPETTVGGFSRSAAAVWWFCEAVVL